MRLNVQWQAESRGFITAISMVVSVAILIVFSAAYSYLGVSEKGSIVIKMNNQNTAMAQSGVHEVVSLLRANSDLSGYPVVPALSPFAGYSDVVADGAPNQVVDGASHVVGYYSAKVKLIPAAIPIDPFYGVFMDVNGNPINQFYLIVVKGWEKTQNPTSSAQIHAYVYLPTIGSYFMAIKGQLIVGPGSDFSTAKVYGRTVDIRYDNTLPTPTRIKKVEYFDFYLPNSWPSDPRSILIDDVNAPFLPSIDQRPIALTAPLVFPGINEDVAYYNDPNTAYIPPLDPPPFPVDPTDPIDPRCNFFDVPLNNDLYPPNIAAPNHHATSFAYYCPKSAHIGKIGGTTTVYGQVIIAAENRIIIHGNITIPNGNVIANIVSYNLPILNDVSHNGYSAPPPITALMSSHADQLILYAKEGFDIDPNWCGGAATGNLKLKGILLISPDQTLRLSSVGSTCLETAVSTKYGLDFLGAIYLGSSPALADRFRNGRTYTYLQTLRTDPPPTREFYQFLRWLVFRQSPA